MNRARLSFGIFPLLLTSLIIVGCSTKEADRVTISGKVLLKDKPLGMAALAFVAKQGAILATTTTNEEGYFSLDVGRGKNKVAVSKLAEREIVPGGQENAEQELMGLDGDTSKSRPQHEIDPKYCDPNSSGLEFTFSKPESMLQIHLD